jgi:hypothetical protein
MTSPARKLPPTHSPQAVLDVVTRALAKSHACWTGGSKATPTDIDSNVTPLRAYEAGYVVAAMEGMRAATGWVPVEVAQPTEGTYVTLRMQNGDHVFYLTSYWAAGQVLHPQTTHWCQVIEPEL